MSERRRRNCTFHTINFSLTLVAWPTTQLISNYNWTIEQLRVMEPETGVWVCIDRGFGDGEEDADEHGPRRCRRRRPVRHAPCRCRKHKVVKTRIHIFFRVVSIWDALIKTFFFLKVVWFSSFFLSMTSGLESAHTSSFIQESSFRFSRILILLIYSVFFSGFAFLREWKLHISVRLITIESEKCPS